MKIKMLDLKRILRKIPFVVSIYQARHFFAKLICYRFCTSSLSFAQCGEDRIIEFALRQLGIHKPVYLDIGAHHPSYLSNTFYFYKKGSVGVCVEPDEFLCSTIRKQRKNDKCLNIGIGITEEDKAASFYVMSTKTLNTFSKVEAERYASYGNHKIEKVLEIPLVTINEVIKNNFIHCPDFVSLDVEGWDLQILKTLDFNQYRPPVFCVETLTYTENNSEMKITEIAEYMLSKNYFVYADTYINSVFVDREAWDARL